MSRPIVRHAREGFRWDGVEVLRYKDEGAASFRDITRQVLFDEVPAGTQWRYFEVAPGGHSTLERHEHTHAVLVLRGRGRVLVGDRVHALAAHDLVEIAPLTWHQFRADAGEALGFLCLVAADRDRPQLPDDEQLAALRADPVVATFLTGSP
ncbi:MAG: cupin domain-containing protein [Burkholderiaceae bacterium]